MLLTMLGDFLHVSYGIVNCLLSAWAVKETPFHLTMSIYKHLCDAIYSLLHCVLFFYLCVC